jgi:hypothetical protein
VTEHGSNVACCHHGLHADPMYKPLILVLLTVCLISSAMAQVKQLTAREYYDELYKAGGLDNFADEYVCFREDDIPVFFLMADSAPIKELLSADDKLKELPKSVQKSLDKGFLMVRAYNKGIANGPEYFDPDTHGNWVEEGDVGTPTAPRKVAIGLKVNWDTLRYTRSVSMIGVTEPYTESGKCERVKPGIHQHGASESQKSR